MAKAAGVKDLLMTPGNYGDAFARQTLGLDLTHRCTCSNYLGTAIDHAAGLGFASLLLVGHLGKLIKAAAGSMNTHSRMADGRRETLTAHAALAGGGPELLRALFDSPTTDAGVDALIRDIQALYAIFPYCYGPPASSAGGPSLSAADLER